MGNGAALFSKQTNAPFHSYLCTVVGVQALVTGAWWVILDWRFKFIPNQKPQRLPEKRVCANTMYEVQSAETEIGGSHPQQSTGFRKNQLPDGVGLPFHVDSGYVDIIVVPILKQFFRGNSTATASEAWSAVARTKYHPLDSRIGLEMSQGYHGTPRIAMVKGWKTMVFCGLACHDIRQIVVACLLDGNIAAICRTSSKSIRCRITPPQTVTSGEPKHTELLTLTQQWMHKNAQTHITCLDRFFRSSFSLPFSFSFSFKYRTFGQGCKLENAGTCSCSSSWDSWYGMQCNAMQCTGWMDG